MKAVYILGAVLCSILGWRNALAHGPDAGVGWMAMGGMFALYYENAVKRGAK